MENLNTQIQTLDEDIFSQLMDETVPDKSASTKDIIGSSKLDTQIAPKEEKDSKPGKEDNNKKEEEKKELTQEEIDAQILESFEDNEDEQKNEKEDKEGKEKDKSSSKSKIDKEASSSILKTQAELLIEKGLWVDFEGSEDFEWTNENYATLVEQQAEWKVEERMSELLDATGPYGKAIISHVQNGGNPELIIDLFKEAKKIESFDTTTEEGKTALLTKYYKDLGWKDARIKRTIDAAVDSGSLDEDVEEAKTEMESAIKEEVDAAQKAQKEYQEAQKRAEEQFAQNITGALKERKDLSIDEKKAIYASVLSYDKKLPDGRVVNQFTLDFAKLQQDPKKYVDLVLFVQNYDKFKQGIAKEEEKKATKKSWEFIKGNGATSKTTSGQYSKGKSTEKSDLVIDWKSFNQ